MLDLTNTTYFIFKGKYYELNLYTKIKILFESILNLNLNNTTFNIIKLCSDNGTVNIFINNNIITFQYYIHHSYIRLTSDLLNDIYLVKKNNLNIKDTQYLYFETFKYFLNGFE